MVRDWRKTILTFVKSVVTRTNKENATHASIQQLLSIINCTYAAKHVRLHGDINETTNQPGERARGQPVERSSLSRARRTMED